MFAKFLDICNIFSADLVNEKGNIPRRVVVLKFSDLEVISLSLTVQSIGIDSESFSLRSDQYIRLKNIKAKATEGVNVDLNDK
jgi:hypothetical protein